jgi:MoxR-like ATPase
MTQTTPTKTLPVQDAARLIESVLNNINQIVVGKEGQIRLALTCLIAGGHLLIEDVPGVGKTTLAHALAKALGLQFARVQFTSDLLPADVLGASIYDRAEQRFIFHTGPIFTQVLLADEINRASPRQADLIIVAGRVSRKMAPVIRR